MRRARGHKLGGHGCQLIPWKESKMGEEKRVIVSKMEVAGLVGPIWFIGWLFTIGFTHLSFWKAVLALIVWPYFLGSALG
ncbi:MAG: hypothetical protein AMJ46_00170 [Latescibacteria bacterium DG_63]|nr:MAG: hypothetical protein AMJ46_00170 [Latescibacteria bacterium DG_63]